MGLFSFLDKNKQANDEEDNPPVKNPRKKPDSKVKGSTAVGCLLGLQMAMTKSIAPSSEVVIATTDEINIAQKGFLHLWKIEL